MLLLILTLILPASFLAQQPIIIDHNCLELVNIPDQWINAAKADLSIGYGHTSHGSQLASGMDALEAYFTNGKYNWSHAGGPGELHLFEGAGYDPGYLELDCGYAGWDDQTRTYLNAFPDCNVIIWSWCGQVNSVDLSTHYFGPMSQLESEYPDVKFVYMTGHLVGEGPSGSLFQANQQIRDYCNLNNKILFDFADIEKYSPDVDTNFQDYFVNDECDYQHPGGGTANWAWDWLDNNPGAELTTISGLCSSCAHSISLNCVKKGIATWYLWARLTGWDGLPSAVEEMQSFDMKIYPNPVRDILRIKFEAIQKSVNIEIRNTAGILVYVWHSENTSQIQNIDIADLATGVYIVFIDNGVSVIFERIIVY